MTDYIAGGLYRLSALGHHATMAVMRLADAVDRRAVRLDHYAWGGEAWTAKRHRAHNFPLAP